jgi:hypothetical protein
MNKKLLCLVFLTVSCSHPTQQAPLVDAGSSPTNDAGERADAGDRTDAGESVDDGGASIDAGAVSSVDAGASTGDGGLTRHQGAAVFDQIMLKARELEHNPPATRLPDFMTYLHGQPEIAEIRIDPSSGTIGVFLVNGQVLSVMLERDQPLPPDGGIPLYYPDGGAVMPRPHTPVPRPRTGGTTAMALPKSIKGLALTGQYSILPSPYLPYAAPAIRDALSKRGFVVPGDTGATIETLTNKVSDLGVFYFETHGGEVFDSSGTIVYALVTKTTFQGSYVDSLDAEINAGDICVVGALNVDDITPKGTDGLTHPRVLITSSFVHKHWNFAQNALVMINSCSLGGVKASGMLNELLSRDGTLLWAWDGPVWVPLAIPSAQYFIDRLLGANDFQSETVPQRPFDFFPIYQDMADKGLVFSHYDDGKTDGGINSALQMQPASVQTGFPFGGLAPSIKTMLVDQPPPSANPYLQLQPSTTLTISGFFGAEPGSVTIDGVPVPLETDGWSSDKVTVTLPSVIGAGFDGDVVVSSPLGIKSNAVPLTSWEGEWVYTTLPLTAQVSVMSTIDYHMYFRGDVHAYRDAPGEDPHAAPELFFRAAPNSECKWADTGSVGPVPVVGSATLAYGLDGSTQPGTGYQFDGTLNMQSFVVAGSVSFLGCVGQLGQNPVVTPLDDTVLTTTMTRGSVEYVMNSSFEIQADSRHSHVPNVATAPTLTWQDVMPNHPPEPTHGEDNQHQP